MASDRRIRLRYWAGARAAAGIEQEEIEAPTVAAALVTAARPSRPGLASVLRRCSFLRDGMVLSSQDLDAQLAEDVEIEVLPPFAGGARPVAPLGRPDDGLLSHQVSITAGDPKWSRTVGS